MVTAGGIEVGRKYDVDELTLMPELHQLPDIARVGQPVEQELEAVYFDTEDLVLSAMDVTLRRRTGGKDAGWHLKVPMHGDERREVHEPLGSKPGQVPGALLKLVRVFVRDRALAPIARLRTRRILHALHGQDDSVLAEVIDDHVQADILTVNPASQQWREWEIELVDGSPALLAAADSMLLLGGARTATHPSKLARTLGGAAVKEKPSPPPRPTPKGPAGAILLAYVSKQIQDLMKQDPRVRQDAPDAVHLMRVTTRRIRSALASYRKLTTPEPTGALRLELKWLTGILSQARDAQVIHARLGDRVRAEPGDLVLGLVSQRIDEELAAEYTTAHHGVLQALDDERYFRLLDSLDTFLADPTLTPLASEPARPTIAKLVREEEKRLRRGVKNARSAPASGSRDLDLHEVRKRAKCLRYAAEAAAVVHGKRAQRLARSAHNIQKILGDHQDSVVTRHLLRRLGAESYVHGENGFTYGRLHALEQAGARDSETRFNQQWHRFPTKSLKK